MLKIDIKEQWKYLLAENGFQQYEDFFKDRDDLELLTMERSASVSKLEIGNSDEKHTLFLKRCFSERPRKVIRRFLRGGIYKQSAVVENENLLFLQELGFNVMEVAAWGVRKRLGYPLTSFLMVPKVAGTEFIDFYRGANLLVRQNLYKEYGRLVGKLHYLGVDSIVRPQDLFCYHDTALGRVELTLIDREEGSTVLSQSDIKDISREIATMFVKGVVRYQQVAIDIKEALSFYHGYLQENESIEMTAKEFHEVVVEEIKKYISVRRYAQVIIHMLPKKVFGTMEATLL